MNAVILNGGPGNGRDAACWKIKDAVEKEFQSRGWAIKDDGESFLRALVASDAAVWITPITFGGYSSALKKALDRSIPVLLPFFIKSHGEVHHPQRYKKRRKLLAVGTLPNADTEAERIFHGLVQRNAFNMNPIQTAACVVYESADDAEVAARIKELVQAAEIA